MVAHFHLTESYAFLYYAISSIETDSAGYRLSGIVGDGSAEAGFEAQIGETLRVTVLPVWDADCEALCQRYDQEQLETSLAEALRDIQLRTDVRYDVHRRCWEKELSAVPAQHVSPGVSIPLPPEDDLRASLSFQ